MPDAAVHFIHPVHTTENAKYFVRGPGHIHVESDTHPKGEWTTSFLAVGREIPLDDLVQFSLTPDYASVNGPFRLPLYIAGLVLRIPSGQLVYAGLSYLDPQDRLHLHSTPTDPFVEELYEPEARIQFELTPQSRDIYGKKVVFDFFGMDAGIHFSLDCPLLARWDANNLLVQTCNAKVAFANNKHDFTLVGHGPWYNAFELAGFALASDHEVSQLPHIDDWDLDPLTQED